MLPAHRTQSRRVASVMLAGGATACPSFRFSPARLGRGEPRGFRSTGIEALRQPRRGDVCTCRPSHAVRVAVDRAFDDDRLRRFDQRAERFVGQFGRGAGSRLDVAHRAGTAKRSADQDRPLCVPSTMSVPPSITPPSSVTWKPFVSMVPPLPSSDASPYRSR
jgi:hypothetical protein